MYYHMYIRTSVPRMETTMVLTDDRG